MLPDSVRDYLAANRDRHLTTLLELLRFPSIANVRGDDDGCGPCAAFLADYLASIGLSAEVMAAEGKPNVVARGGPGAGAPTVLIYGHYDVQPPDPLDLWRTDPFEPVVADGRVYARGANDNKGQCFANIMGIEAWAGTDGLPVNVTLLIEGQEEIGSPGLEQWVADHKDLLTADAAFLSDSPFFAADTPSITYGLRGLVYAEITASGPRRDVHSGEFGGGLANPINALAELIGRMRDDDGRVTLPGFYDDVRPIGDDERAEWAKLNFDASAMAASVGAPGGILGGGERHLPPLERLWARPTLDCNGICGGYSGAGAKTIIPATASAKISMRLVADQDPVAIRDGLLRFVTEHTPAGIAIDVHFHASARPVLIPRNAAAMQAGAAAMAEGFGRHPALVRCGASVPVTELIQRLLGLDAIVMGYGLPDDNLHSPNEKFDLDQLYNGSVAGAAMLGNLAGV